MVFIAIAEAAAPHACHSMSPIAYGDVRLKKIVL